MRRKNLSLMMTTTTLGSSGVDFRFIPTAAERAAGRFMRSPDGHGDAGSGADGDGSQGASAAADGGSGAGGGDQGGQGGAGDAGGAGSGADPGDGTAGGDANPGTILGEAASGEGDDAGGKTGEGDGAKDGAKEGQEGATDAAIEVLGAPEKYDIKLPEAAAGMEFDQEAFSAVEPILRGLNLSNDAAQALVGAYAGKVLPLLEKRAGERWDATGADMRKGWEADARSDPEIGGAKFDETKSLARATFVRFGVKSDGPFLKLLEESGLGNHPDMLRFVANVGRLTGEASVDAGGGGQAQPRLADRVYGSPTPRE